MTPSGSAQQATGSANHAMVGDRLARVASSVAVTVLGTATIREVAVQMTANDIGLVVVSGDGRLQGVVSERDLVRAMADGVDPDDERASDIMSVDVVSADASTTVSVAADMMLDGGIRHLPVVEDGRVVGVVSIRDLLPAVHPD